MITLFAIPRPFDKKYKIIQLNALRSWAILGIPVIIFGNEAGTENVVQELKLKHVIEVKTNKFGTPILSDVFSRARKIAATPLIGYINSDIILLSDFVDTISSINLPKYILGGQRKPLRVNEEIVGKCNWQSKLLTNLASSKPIMGSSDYFVFPRSLSLPLPPFATGRYYWDKWFFYYAKKASIPIINATSSITAIHQQHYPRPNQHGLDEGIFGEEASNNLQLLGGRLNCFTIYDADFVLKSQCLNPVPITPFKILRDFEIKLILLTVKLPQLRPLLQCVKWLRFVFTLIRKNLNI